MTLCAGWVDSEAVYLAADSAVSRLGNPRILRHDYSSFGEMQYQGSVRTVEESALKILRHQNVAAAFSGDVSGMNDLFTNFIQGSHFMLTREAFDAAWVSSQGGEKKLWALLGYHDQAGPHLFKYDPTTVSGEETRSDCIGYLNEDDKQFLREMLPQTLKQTSVRDRLVSTACRIQRPGMFLNLMESHGIGGHIAGCSIDKDGLRWTPDTIHVLLFGDPSHQQSLGDVLSVILTCERFDMFFVCNFANGGYSGFRSSFGMNTGLEYEEVVKKILSNKEQLPPISTDLRVDYVVFHDVVTRLSTIFNVRDGAQNLKYWLSREPGKPLVQFAATKQGLAALKRPSGDIAFVDY